MSKDVVSVDGKEVAVREDTAKAFRGVRWMAVVLAIFAVIMIFAALAVLTPWFRSGVEVTRPSTNDTSVR